MVGIKGRRREGGGGWILKEWIKEGRNDGDKK